MTFLIILAIPLIIAIVGFFLPIGKTGWGENKISWKEFLILVGVSVICTLLSMGIIYYQNIMYPEVWNGVVTKKQKEKVSCEHSYPCHCHEVCSGSGKHESCSEHCDTCYEHPYDFSYFVYDSAAQTFSINRIDSQGLETPPRWTAVNMNDPTSSSHMYKDYIKGSSVSLFKKEVKYENFQIPSYPTIYDYYNLDRILTSIAIKDIKIYQRKLSEINGVFGPLKQCNIIMVIVKKQNPNYYYALQQKWAGGSKNDIVVMISVDDTNKIEWINILCFAESDFYRIKLRDSILAIGTLDMDKILSEIEINTRQYYKRKHMKDFEYLSASVEPTGVQLIAATIINMLICLGLAIFFWKDNSLD